MKILKNKYSNTFSTPTLLYFNSLKHWYFNNPTSKIKKDKTIIEYYIK